MAKRRNTAQHGAFNATEDTAQHQIEHCKKEQQLRHSEGEKQRVRRNSETRKDTEKHDKYSEGKCSKAPLGSTERSTRHSAVKHSNNHGKHSARIVKAGSDRGDGYRRASNQLNSTIAYTYIEIAYMYVLSKEEKQTTQRSSERREP